MKPEILARIVLFFLLAAAGFVGVMAVGGGAAGAETPSYTLFARMPENGGWSLETLHAEVGRPVHLRMTSEDVVHSFAIGQGYGQTGGEPSAPIELKPGEWAETTLVFERPGRYTFYCTRWCGRNHWRMRGTIEVSGAGEPVSQSAEKPLYLQLGLDVDAPHPASVVPEKLPSTQRGEQAALALGERLPPYTFARETYRTSSPADLFERLRGEPTLQDQPDLALWDVVAYAWQRQTSPEDLALARDLFAANCAACHGETGRGDGVMVEDLPRFDPSKIHIAGHPQGEPEMGLAAPPDFTDPRGILGASPALLEGKMLRGGMGTGMPYWGPIFTEEEMDALVAYIYMFTRE